MTTFADYSEMIPNNIDLNSDRRLKRAPRKLAPQIHQLVEKLGT